MLRYAASADVRDRASFLRSLPLWQIVLICSGLPLAWLAWQIVANPAVLVEATPDAFRMKLLARTLAFNGAAASVATLLGSYHVLVRPTWIGAILNGRKVPIRPRPMPILSGVARTENAGKRIY